MTGTDSQDLTNILGSIAAHQQPDPLPGEAAFQAWGSLSSKHFRAGSHCTRRKVPDLLSLLGQVTERRGRHLQPGRVPSRDWTAEPWFSPGRVCLDSNHPPRL